MFVRVDDALYYIIVLNFTLSTIALICLVLPYLVYHKIRQFGCKRKCCPIGGNDASIGRICRTSDALTDNA